jgi:hypothetical protein
MENGDGGSGDGDGGFDRSGPRGNVREVKSVLK